MPKGGFGDLKKGSTYSPADRMPNDVRGFMGGQRSNPGSSLWSRGGSDDCWHCKRAMSNMPR